MFLLPDVYNYQHSYSTTEAQLDNSLPAFYTKYF